MVGPVVGNTTTTSSVAKVVIFFECFHNIEL